MNAGERKAGYPNSQGHAQLPAGYGLTLIQLEDLRKAQARGDIKMVPAIGEDGDYEVPEHEFLYVYHVETQSPIFHRTGGHREDRGATVQKYNVVAFKHMEKNGGFRGQEVVILHDPERAQAYVAEQTAKANEKEANPQQGNAGEGENESEQGTQPERTL